ncbi:hypothetical protein GU926_08265 [Nibribacter ruber]|uniref:Uncharacterized protein n=1 Tax=Nibribacter ruber TaxID=2698458 RepID=A0A6P1NWK4_9BACT|nr:hypothetical protein [Nibribacter ruber]QHL87430.1 hypothetical protein GU926_08265 [Nibribacter ruber]
MKKYKVLGGGEINASSFLSLVTQMQEQSFTPSSDLPDFMRQVADRCMIQRGSVIRTDSTENFAQDLMANGFLEQV